MKRKQTHTQNFEIPWRLLKGHDTSDSRAYLYSLHIVSDLFTSEPSKNKGRGREKRKEREERN